VEIASFLGKHEGGNLGRIGSCPITDANRWSMLGNDACLKTVEGKKNDLLLGDSLAGALWSGVRSALPDDEVLLTSVTNCKPFVHPEGTAECKSEMNYIFGTYLPSHPIQLLMLEGRWKRENMDALAQTVEWARERSLPVVVFGPVPEYDAPLPRLLAYSVAWNKPELASLHRVASRKPLDVEMEHLATDKWHVPYISLYRTICHGDACLEFADEAHEIPLMNDEVHLNDFGSALVARDLVASGALR
jgi:hypothetical protein